MAQNAIEEIFTILPYESAIAMRRGMEFGICSSVLLLCHCAYLVAAYWDSSSPADSFLRALSVGRLMCAIPRFRFWFETHQQFVRARLAATPQLATQQMIWIYANPSRLERVLLFTYYIWLLLVSVLVGLGPIFNLGFDSSFCAQLWVHCTYSFAAIILHRVVCVALFYALSRADFDRGISATTLEKYTKSFVYSTSAHTDDDEDCAICYAAYQDGDACRRLVCRHYFHQNCIDVWVLRHQNRCPLCLSIVGPVSSTPIGDTPPLAN